MKTVVIVDFKGGNRRSPLISAITSLTQGSSITYHHDPERLKTPFYRWIAQIRNRHGLPGLRSSKYQIGDDGKLCNGKQGRPLTVQPQDCYTIWLD